MPIEALVRILEIAGPDLTKEGFRDATYIAMDSPDLRQEPRRRTGKFNRLVTNR